MITKLTCCFAATLTTLWLKGMFFMKNHFCPCFITVDTTETVNRTDRCRIVYMSVCTHFHVCEMDRRRRRVENTCIFQSNNISSVYHLFVGNERCKIYCFYSWWGVIRYYHAKKISRVDCNLARAN